MSISENNDPSREAYIGMKQLKIKRPPLMDFSGTEAVNSICANILFSGPDLKTILLTSCVASEGKSTMAARLLLQCASRGLKTVYVDLDLRKSESAGRLGLKTKGRLRGLAHYLAGRVEIEEVIYKTDLPNVYIAPVGRTVPNPISLINSPAFGVLFARLKNEFDMIIVDTPPVGLVIDAADIARVCDGSILVIEYGKRRRGEVRRAVTQMEKTSTPVLGCIIDKVTVSSISEKKYYKTRYYGAGYENKKSGNSKIR